MFKDWDKYYEDCNFPEWGRKFIMIPFFDTNNKQSDDKKFAIEHAPYSLISLNEQHHHIEQVFKQAKEQDATLVFHCNWEAPDFEDFPVDGEIKLEKFLKHKIGWENINILAVLDDYSQQYDIEKVYLITAGLGVNFTKYKTNFVHINCNMWFEHYNHSFNYDLAQLFTHTPPPGNAYHSVHWQHKQKPFNLLLGKPKPSRCFSMMMSRRHNLIENNLVSFNAMNHTLYLDDPCYNSFSPQEKEWLRHHKTMLIDSEPLLDDHLYQNTYAIPGAKLWQQSLVSAVNEAMFTSTNIFFSEKIFRTFENFHPFVLIGQAKSLDHLRNEGFDLFDDILDHSYDNVTDGLGRVVKVFETLKDVNYRFRDYIDLFNNKEVEHRLKRNYKLIMNQKKMVKQRYLVSDSDSFVKRILFKEQREDNNDCPRYIWGL